MTIFKRNNNSWLLLYCKCTRNITKCNAKINVNRRKCNSDICSMLTRKHKLHKNKCKKNNI